MDITIELLRQAVLADIEHLYHDGAEDDEPSQEEAIEHVRNMSWDELVNETSVTDASDVESLQAYVSSWLNLD